jgi:hypothetical protein
MMQQSGSSAQQGQFNPTSFFQSSLNKMNQKSGMGRSSLSNISMSAGPRISGDVSMAVKEDHMDEEMAKLSNKLGIDDLGASISG